MARYVETKIRRLTREIAKIDKFFYGGLQRDRVLYAGMLERKRDDIVRSVVLQLHTAIEDVLTSWITCRVLEIKAPEQRRARSKAAHALRKVLSGSGSIGFDSKLNLAIALRLISGRTRGRLAELNKLRNRCSHNWLLNVKVRRGKGRKGKKPPLLHFKGRDLHRAEVLTDFLGEYGPLYAKVWATYMSYRAR